MVEINPAIGPNTQMWVDETGGTTTAPTTTPGSGTMPPVTVNLGDLQITLSMPTLPAPKIGGLSLESLVQALGMDERATATKSGLESIKVRAQEREEVNAKKMEEIQKNLEDMKSKGILDGFLKAFKIIGIVVGAVAAVATIAVGVAGLVAGGSGALLIAAGSVMLAMTVNSIVSEATDGKVSIGAGVAALAKACGASEEVAQWIGLGVELAITLVGVGLSLGAGFASASGSAATIAASAAEKAAKTVTHIVAITQKVTTIAAGVNTVAQGVTQGVSAGYDYSIAMSRAEQKELEAILEQVMQAIQMEQDFLEAIMERSNDLMGKVSDIVQENVAAQTAVLGGAAPTMA